MVLKLISSLDCVYSILISVFYLCGNQFLAKN